MHCSADGQIIALRNVDTAPGCCCWVVLEEIAADCREKNTYINEISAHSLRSKSYPTKHRDDRSLMLRPPAPK